MLPGPALTLTRPQLNHTISRAPSDTYGLDEVGSILSISTRSGRRRLYHYGIHGGSDLTPHMLWKVRREDLHQDTDLPRVTSMLPIELDHIVLAFSTLPSLFDLVYIAYRLSLLGDGYIARSSLVDLVKHGAGKPSEHLSDYPLAGPITGMHMVRNERTGERRILGGSDDGAIAIWSLE